LNAALWHILRRAEHGKYTADEANAAVTLIALERTCEIGDVMTSVSYH